MIWELLGAGEENAVTMKELKNRGWTEREIRERIRQERFEGHLICSGQSGYYLPQTVSDVMNTVNRLETISKETKAVAEKMKEEMARL
ncbi:MAG: hypothetical protein IKQ49_00110 [Eubacterium sp.]|nr:hypothetical protein [Eubacterium sp.]